MRYRFFDLILASDWLLPELAVDEAHSSCHNAGESPAITIERADARVGDRDVAWFHEWRLSKGEPWLAAARLPGGGYLLRVPDLADFLVDAVGACVRIFREAETSDDTLRHLLLDHILPLMVSHRGELVLHASAALIGRGAVLFGARSGSGKSTLAAALASRGAQVLGDDAIALRANGVGLIALGAYPGLRLWPDVLARTGRQTGPAAEYSDKRRVGPGASEIRFSHEPAPVTGIYALDPSPAGPIRVDPLPPRDALMALVANAYVLDIGDRDRLTRQLDCAIGSGRAVPVRRLRFPHDIDRLGDVCDALLADV
ncbi:MAG: hypothetical protein ACRD09_11605 [Vicinamibacterales bacterium]